VALLASRLSCNDTSWFCTCRCGFLCCCSAEEADYFTDDYALDFCDDYIEDYHDDKAIKLASFAADGMYEMHV
jgi:hypothetical protein